MTLALVLALALVDVRRPQPRRRLNHTREGHAERPVEPPGGERRGVVRRETGTSGRNAFRNALRRRPRGPPRNDAPPPAAARARARSLGHRHHRLRHRAGRRRDLPRQVVTFRRERLQLGLRVLQALLSRDVPRPRLRFGPFNLFLRGCHQTRSFGDGVRDLSLGARLRLFGALLRGGDGLALDGSRAFLGSSQRLPREFPVLLRQLRRLGGCSLLLPDQRREFLGVGSYLRHRLRHRDAREFAGVRGGLARLLRGVARGVSDGGRVVHGGFHRRVKINLIANRGANDADASRRRRLRALHRVRVRLHHRACFE